MADCTVLAVASTTQTVCALLHRLVKDAILDDQGSVVPWTIVNKYYTANVGFLVHSLSSLASVRHELFGPALLFVWNKGEPYRDQIRKLSHCTSQHEFEVALAIRLSPTGSVLPVEIENDQDTDAYLSSKGFEFVDVLDVEASSFPDRSGVLGIPRIIDALSTIMWPSMVRQGFVSAGQTNPSFSSDDYHNLARLVGEKISGNNGDRMRRELEELERWLDADDADGYSTEDEAVPWSTAVTPGTLSPSSSGFLEHSRPTTPKAGFDDDFTSFVSASSTTSSGLHGAAPEGLSFPQRFPPLASTNFSSTFNFDSTSSGRMTPILDDHASLDTTHLAPGGFYRSLGSESDFGDLDKESVNLGLLSNGSEVEDMPSRIEIAEAAHKIFGTIHHSLSPVQETGDMNFQTPIIPGAAAAAAAENCPGEDLDVEMADSDLERFDLQGVLGALQGLKEEIARMPDNERRKAAARVALGLAYGLNTRFGANEELV